MVKNEKQLDPTAFRPLIQEIFTSNQVATQIYAPTDMYVSGLCYLWHRASFTAKRFGDFHRHKCSMLISCKRKPTKTDIKELGMGNLKEKFGVLP